MFASVYITTSGKKEAKKIARLLVTKRLAACANIFPVESVYRWKGKVQSDKEYAIIAKTRKRTVKKLVAAVKKVHSYSTPCIVSWPISAANRDYLKWIKKETK